jgi:hypothetical protein
VTAPPVEDRVGSDVVGFADGAEYVGEVGAKLRMVSQHLVVPEGRRDDHANAVRVTRLSDKTFVWRRHYSAQSV